MEIKYLEKLKTNKELHPGFPRKGWLQSQIEELEAKYNNGNLFPIAFREYLHLAGNYGGTSLVDEDWDDVNEDCTSDMEKCGYKLDRPYFVFDNYDSQYSIFFLDEDKEDPDVYLLSPFLAKGNSEPLLKKSLTGTFSNLINEAIYRIKNNLPF